MVKKEIEINQELLPVLAYLAGPVEQVLSPWARFKETTEPTEAQWQKLQETGLANTAKVLNTDVAETIDYLKTPTRFLRLRLQAGPMLLEHLIYSCKKAGASEKILISFTAGQEKTIISNPAPLEMILVGLLEHLGDSSLTSSALKLKLSRESALVFAAIVDLQRRKALADIAAMQSFKQPLFDKAEILEALNDVSANHQWLTATISAFYNQKESLTSAKLQAALDDLIKQEMVALENDKYLLKGQALSFANHFLLVNRILKLELGTLQSNTEAARSEMLCLQAGNHDLLYLEQENEQLIIEAVSAHYIAEIIDALLTKENDIPEEQAEHYITVPPPPVPPTLQSATSNSKAASKDTNFPPPPAFNRDYQSPKVSVPSKQSPVFHAAGAKDKSSLARFKLPLIIVGVLIGIFVFIAIIASLYDDSMPVAEPPSSNNDQTTTGVNSSSAGTVQPDGNSNSGISDTVPPDAGSSFGTTDLLSFSEPGYGFTMNYPQGWIYDIDELGFIFFQGPQGTEEHQLSVIVDIFPTRSVGGVYDGIEELYVGEIDYYFLEHGESFGYETSIETIGGSQHKVVFGGGAFEHQSELYPQIAVIIERDNSVYYGISYFAPEDIFYDYQDLIFDVFFSSFSFTD